MELLLAIFCIQSPCVPECALLCFLDVPTHGYPHSRKFLVIHLHLILPCGSTTNLTHTLIHLVAHAPGWAQGCYLGPHWKLVKLSSLANNQNARYFTSSCVPRLMHKVLVALQVLGNRQFLGTQ